MYILVINSNHDCTILSVIDYRLIPESVRHGHHDVQSCTPIDYRLSQESVHTSSWENYGDHDGDHDESKVKKYILFLVIMETVIVTAMYTNDYRLSPEMYTHFLVIMMIMIVHH